MSVLIDDALVEKVAKAIAETNRDHEWRGWTEYAKLHTQQSHAERLARAALAVGVPLIGERLADKVKPAFPKSPTLTEYGCGFHDAEDCVSEGIRNLTRGPTS